jgi:hypothetical protein
MDISRQPDSTPRAEVNARNSGMTLQKWGGLASFLLALLFLLPELIYLMGNLRDAFGTQAYSLADFLYGPLKAVCLAMAGTALGDRIGGHASRRKSLSLLTAALAAGTFVAASLLRASNRQYHLVHPELNLEMNTTVLSMWTTLLTGVISTAWHFLGWSLLLLGSAGWSSRRLPRGLCVLYGVTGAVSLFVYLVAELEGAVVLLGMVMCFWQGIVLWRAEPVEAQKT